MKKRIIIIQVLILLILFPSFVLAKDTCNDNDIKIKSVTLKELNGFSEEIQESSINNNTINLNLKMYDVGDFSTYDITVENTSDEDYYFTKDSMKIENDYLEYGLKNDSEVIPAKNEKTIELKVSYKNKISNDSYLDTSKLTISLSDKPLENPKTKMTYTFIFIIISLMVITIYTKINNKPFSKKKILLVISLLSIIPITTTALCIVNLDVETKIEIENKEAVFLPGKEVNIKMKELAGDDTSSITNRYAFKDDKIKAIKYSNQEPIDSNKEEKNIVSTSGSPYSIYMWFEDGTIYWWSEDSHPSLNEDASYIFNKMINLKDINCLSNWDTSNTINMEAMFAYSTISSLLPLKNWDTSKVTNLVGIFLRNDSLITLEGLENWDVANVSSLNSSFMYDTNLKTIDAIKNWDVANVTTLNSTFADDYNLESVDAIKNWNVSKVETMKHSFISCYSLEKIDLSNWKTTSLKNMNNTFGMWGTDSMPYYDSKLKEIKLSEKFDTSKVTDMYALFANNRQIEDYNFLQYIDIQSAENIAQMFQFNSKLKDIKILKNWDTSNLKTINGFIQHTSVESLEGLENWDVSKVTDMRFAFRDCKINNLTPIKNWDVSNVDNFGYMFPDNPNLTDASAINNWNISITASFTKMFTNTPAHPEFTKVQGTWSSGTFTSTP